MRRLYGSLTQSKVSDDSDKLPDRSFSKWDKFLPTPNENPSSLSRLEILQTIGSSDERGNKRLQGASVSDSTWGGGQLNSTIVGVDGQGLIDTPLLEDINVGEARRSDLKNSRSSSFVIESQQINLHLSTSGIEDKRGISVEHSKNISAKNCVSTSYSKKEKVKQKAISLSNIPSTVRLGGRCSNISVDESDPEDDASNLRNILTERERNLLYHNVDLDDTTSQYFSTEAPCTSKSVGMINTPEMLQKATTSSYGKPLNTISTFERSQFPGNGTFQSIDLSSDKAILGGEGGLDISELEETYLALSIGVNYVGAACYNVSSTILELVPDMMDKKLSNIIEQLMRETGATKLLFSKMVQTKVESILQTIEDMTGCKTSATLISLSSSDFRYETSRRRLFNISLPCFNQLNSQMEREFYVLSKINETDKNMVRAAGALLKYLENKRIGIELENTALSVPILDVKVLSLSDMMFIDDFSLKALQIFSQISHPSGFKLGYHNSKREGVSLYGLLNFCRSRVGSFCLRTWLMKPLKKKSILEERLDAVEYFSLPRNTELTATLKTHLAKTGFLKTILSKMKQSEMTHGEWVTLCKTVFACMSIGDLCKDRVDDAPIFRRMVDKCGESLYRVGSWLHRILDLEETSAQKRFVVKFGIEPELDEKKRTYGRLPEILSNVASSEMSRLQDHITECGCIYLPQIGYLFTTPATIEDETDPIMKDLGFDFCVRK